jgi:hypothetical protein
MNSLLLKLPPVPPLTGDVVSTAAFVLDRDFEAPAALLLAPPPAAAFFEARFAALVSLACFSKAS